MCSGEDIKCEVTVVKLKNGYQVQIIGGNLRNMLNPKNLKKCIEACCAGEMPFKDTCCR